MTGAPEAVPDSAEADFLAERNAIEARNDGPTAGGGSRLRYTGSVSPPPPSIDAGDVLDDKYCLLHALSVGGMGTLFVAHNAILDVRVAIKLIRRVEGAEGDDDLEGRLLQEARAAARLGHPAIVRVLDFGRSPMGDPYIVMELLNGEDLRAALTRRGRIATSKAVRLLLPIANALWTAHERDIVHRDVKPANIFLAQTDEGTLQPKLIDFGVAKMHMPLGDRLTQVGACVGTPEYMCPELARGEDAGAEADIWAFCVVLYELVTGELPFVGTNLLALLRSIVEDDPLPLTTYGVDDEPLNRILTQGLSKHPKKRWGSMRELGQALALMLLERGITEDICGASLDLTWLDAGGHSGSTDGLSSNPPDDEGVAPADGTLVVAQPNAPNVDAFGSTLPGRLRLHGHSATAPGIAALGEPLRTTQPSAQTRGRWVRIVPEVTTPSPAPSERARDSTPPSSGEVSTEPTPTSSSPSSARDSQPGEVAPSSDPDTRSPTSAGLRPPSARSERDAVDAQLLSLSQNAAALRRTILLGFALVALAILLVGGAAVAVWAWRTTLLTPPSGLGR